MNTELTELVFILDRSGSMGGLESDTIGGFNVEIIEPLTDKDYYVWGCTALLDAVGQAIIKIDNVQKHLPENHKAGKILFVITTDGLENLSEEFTYKEIKRMIEAKKECGWEFLFLGANIDAEKEAEKIGCLS